MIDPILAQLRALCAALAPEDFYVSPEAAMSAMQMPQGQFNVRHPGSGNKIDFMIAGQDAWGREQISRRQREQIFPEMQGYAARAEDIILSKLRYYQEGGSEKHVRDIGGILRVSGAKIDRPYVERWAAELGVSEVWRAIVDREAL